MIIIFETYALSVILVCFPIILYLIFFAFKDHFKKGESECALEISLILVLFLLVYFKTLFNLEFFIPILTIPILLSFIFKKTKTSVLLSIIDIIIISKYTEIHVLIILSLLELYYLIYYIYKTTTKTNFHLGLIFSLITSVFIAGYYCYIDSLNNDFLMAILIYNSSMYTILYIINRIKKSLKVYSTFKEIEKDERTKINIFKVAHEIKNPLAVIKGYLSIINLKDNNKTKKYIDIINIEVENALQVLYDLSEINHLKIIKEKVEFNKLLNELKDTVIPFLNDKKIKYSFKCEDNLIVNADYNRLKQVFVNLIKNSVEALDDNGIIEIRCYKTNKNLIITIKDNGCGMDKETLDNIFVPFYTKKSYGTGLGLSLSKEIIESHGGSIKYFSNLGSYTLVKVILPN